MDVGAGGKVEALITVVSMAVDDAEAEWETNTKDISGILFADDGVGDTDDRVAADAEDLRPASRGAANAEDIPPSRTLSRAPAFGRELDGHTT